MREMKQARMAVPAPGFTERVMARIAEREVRVARRRAMVGIGLLVFATAIPVFLFGFALVSAAVFLFSSPETFFSVALTIAPLAVDLSPIVEALVISASAAMETASLQIMVYAVAVLGLTLLWMRVVGGSLQLSHNLSLGGSK